MLLTQIKLIGFDQVYACSPEQLYLRYPQHFLNIYDNSVHPVELMPEYPIHLASGEYADAHREAAIAEYLSGVKNLEYRTAYANADNILHPVDHEADSVWDRVNDGIGWMVCCYMKNAGPSLQLRAKLGLLTNLPPGALMW